MDVYNQFVYPSTSLFSVYCNFVAKDQDNLIISKGNLLQIFNIVPTENNGSNFNEENGSSVEDSFKPPYKLVLVSEYALNGKILDIHKFRSNEDEDVDYLLVSTELAKISIVKWNPSDHLVSVVSLHYYETVLNSLLMEKLNTSTVLHRTDPNYGCTTMLVDDLFVFLPFKKNDSGDFDLNDDYNPVIAYKEKLNNSVDSSTGSDLFYESFLVNAKTLHSDLKNVVDIQFLYSYPNPTLAILYGPETLSWAGCLPKTKDNMKIIVLSLDLETKSADVIIEISNLPYDVDRIYALQHPINGFLLIGSNEIIHINSLGAIKGIYTNEFFSETSSLNLKNQSSLDLLLELSEVCQIGDSEVLLVSNSGKIYTLIFDEIGGVSNLNRITANNESTYSSFKINSVLDITNIPGKNLMFISSQGSDGLLLNWYFESNAKETASKAEIGNDIFDADDDFWLYEDETNQNAEGLTSSLTKCNIIVSDDIINIGPVSDFTLGYLSVEPKLMGLPNPNFKETTIFASSGLDDSGGISIIAPSVKPLIKSSLKFSNASKIWTVPSHKGETKYLITTDQKTAQTQIFEVAKNYKDLTTKSFKNNSYTIQFGCIITENRVRPIQVLPHKVMVYSMVFGRVTSMSFEKEINHSVIHDNYIIVIMTTGEIEILEYDDSTKKLSKMDLPALLNFLIFTNAWISKSSLLNHATPIKKRTSSGDPTEVTQNFEEEVLFWLVTADNRLLVFRKEHLEKVFEFKSIHKMSEYLQLSAMDPNYEADVDPILKQCIFTKIGDKYDTKDYLIILTFGGEVVMYQSFFDPVQQCFKFIKANDLFQLPITGAPANSYSYATKIERNLFKITNLDGSNVVMVTGATPFMIYKQYNAFPRMFKFTSKPLLYFAPFSSDKCKDGLITIDDKKSCRMVQLDLDFDYSNKLPILKCLIGETVNKIVYHELSNIFIISTLKKETFKPKEPEGEDLPEPANKKDYRIKAQNFRGNIKLLSPEKWTIIDNLELEENESCTTLDVLNLKLNGTEGNRLVIFVGTGIFQSEDVSTDGTWKLCNLINVVPEPGKPEAKHRLKVLCSETAKGPVLDACSVDGRFAVIQGQRMLVRMLKSEGNAAPVAFTDTSLYSGKVKSFENLMLIGDCYHSVTLYGFDAEPYRMISLGKDDHHMNLSECEFIVHNQNLYILASDDNSVLHIFQYDPYDSNSLKGLRLLKKSSFRSNAHTTKMINCSRRKSFFSMVSTLPIRKDVDLGYEVIASNIDGSFYKVSPINEYQYRRLYSLQNYIAEKEHHWLGLNPKMNAVGNLQNELTVIKRPFIEYRVLTKFSSMNEDKKRMFAMRLGKDALVDIYRDMISLQ